MVRNAPFPKTVGDMIEATSPHGEVLRLLAQLRAHVLANEGRIPPKFDDATTQLATLTREYMVPDLPELECLEGMTLLQSRILSILAARFGKLVSKDSLMNTLYFREPDPPTTKIVDVEICHIRNRLTKLDSPYWIKTHWGRGYSLIKDESRVRLRNAGVMRAQEAA